MPRLSLRTILLSLPSATVAAALLAAPLPAAAVHFAEAVRGRIVLDVEKDGAAWYVNPVNVQRISLGLPDDAFKVMRDCGLGISDADLAAIPKETETRTGDAALRTRLSGRILIQTQANGEAWYVNPVNTKRYYLGRPADALRIMRELGLGITHDNLLHIAEAGSDAGGVLFKVPFVAQAPYGDWTDLRQEEGCEETSALMAVRWAEGRGLTRAEALQEITAMADHETASYGYHVDTSADDTAQRLFKDYLKYDNIEVRHDIGTDDILKELRAGNLVVVPVDGTKLGNPHFGPGVRRHMIVIAGYDEDADAFIADDPGTRYGEHYLYDRKILAGALEDYASGVYAPIAPHSTAMIIVKQIK